MTSFSLPPQSWDRHDSPPRPSLRVLPVKTKKKIVKKRQAPLRSTSTNIHHTSHPQLFDLIIAYSDRQDLPALRRVCQRWKDRVDRLLARHLALRVQASTWVPTVYRGMELSPSRRPLIPPFLINWAPRGPGSWGELWAVHGPHVRVIDFGPPVTPNNPYMRTFASALTRLTTIRDFTGASQKHPKGKGNVPIAAHTSIPSCDVYIARNYLPDFTLGVPLRPGGRVVLTDPSALGSAPVIPGDHLVPNHGFTDFAQYAGHEIVVIFPPTPSPGWSVAAELARVARLFGQAFASLKSASNPPRVTLVHKTWTGHGLTSAYPGEAVVHTTLVALGFDFEAAKTIMPSSAFITLEEYRARVGDNQLRLELSPVEVYRLGL